MNGELTRVFLALWPDENVRKALARLSAEVARNGRRVPPSNIHMTLRFIGDVDAPRLAALRHVIEGFAWCPGEILLDTLGYWSRQQLVFAAPRHGHEWLAEIVERLEAALGACGLPKCRRAFKPHITLARKVRHQPPEVQFEIPWCCERLVLVQSTLSSSGARYTVLARAS